MRLSSFRIRLVISLTTFGLLWFAVDGEWIVFLSALLPTLAQILLNDISYRDDKDRAVALAVAQAVDELLATRFERIEHHQEHSSALQMSVPRPKAKRRRSTTASIDQAEHYAWLRERGVINNRQFEMLVNRRD